MSKELTTEQVHELQRKRHLDTQLHMFHMRKRSADLLIHNHNRGMSRARLEEIWGRQFVALVFDVYERMQNYPARKPIDI